MKCIICGKNELRKIPLIHEVSRYDKKAYGLYQCKKCGFTRPNPLPYEDDIHSEIYDIPENIKFYDIKNKKIDRKNEEYIYYFKHFKPYIDIIKSYGIKGKAMDIGCGAGHLMIMMKENGLSVEGLEVSPILVKALLKDKLKVYCCDIKELKKRNKKYDLVTMNQVLEHVVDPENFVKSVNRIVNKSGYLILAVPYIWGIIPKILRTKWYGLGYGQHLNFFSKESIRILLERNGFKVLESKLLSVDYAHPKFPLILNRIAGAIMFMTTKLGLGDNLFVIAKKVGGSK